MIDAVRSVAQGAPYFSEGLEKKIAARRKRDPLSPREYEVLELLVNGRSNKEIEAALNLSRSTVKHHIAHIFAKLGVQDRTQAATVAVQRGIVDLE
tara:strand:- start:125 stop:412 length:288 start_codon:yes stop_codon:yes gene_type:complete